MKVFFFQNQKTVVILCLLSAVFSESIISLHEGIAISEIGEVALVDQFENLNILIRIPTIPRVRALSCLSDDEDSRERLNNLQYNLNAVMNDYHNFVDSRRALLREYLPFNSSHSIGRRSVWATVGGFLYSTLVAGLTEIQVLQLKRHLKDTQSEVIKLRTSLSNLKNENVLFEKHTVALVKQFNYLLQREITFENCLSEMSDYISNTKVNVLAYRTTIDNLLSPAISGARSVPLSPSILDPEILTKIVRTHDTFNDLIFSVNPVYLYSISRITIVEIDELLTTANYILTFPRIRSDSIFPLNKVSQLGLFVTDNLCRYFSIPANTFEEDNLMKSIDLQGCSQHGSLHVCEATKFLFPPSCIQHSTFQCNFTVSECIEPYALIQLKSGVLFRDNGDDHFARDLGGTITIPSVSQGRIGFVSWNSSKEFQLQAISLESHGLTVAPLTINNFSTPLRFNLSDHIVGQRKIHSLLEDYDSSIKEHINETYGG